MFGLFESKAKAPEPDNNGFKVDELIVQAIVPITTMAELEQARDKLFLDNAGEERSFSDATAIEQYLRATKPRHLRRLLNSAQQVAWADGERRVAVNFFTDAPGNDVRDPNQLVALYNDVAYSYHPERTLTLSPRVLMKGGPRSYAMVYRRGCCSGLSCMLWVKDEQGNPCTYTLDSASGTLAGMGDLFAERTAVANPEQATALVAACRTYMGLPALAPTPPRRGL